MNSKTSSNSFVPDIKLETLLYLAILGLAAFLRLYRLGLAPLSADEAAQALAAWRGALPPSGASPLLYAINAILFGLMGPSDSLARLGAALFGTILVGLPALLRQRLGRSGALGAAFILAISPTAIIASRTLSGEIVTAVVGLGLLGIGELDRRGERQQIYSLAALTALGLIGGSSFYTLALIFAGGLFFAPPSTFNLRLSALNVKRLTFLVAAIVIGVSTLLLWRPANLSAVGDLPIAWLRGFRLEAGITAMYLPVQILFFYEMLALLTGLIGLIIAAQRRDHLAVWLGYWALAALLITMLRQGRTPQDVILMVVPLACLSAYALEELADSLQRMRLNIIEFVFIVAILVIMAFGLLALADYVANPGNVYMLGNPANPTWIHRAAIEGLLALTLLGIVILLLFGVVMAKSALRSIAIAALIFVTLGTWAAGWGAAQAHPGDPRELIVGPQPASLALRLMVNTLEIASAQQTGDARALPLIVLTRSSPQDAVVEWTLHEFPHVAFVSALDETSQPYAVVTPVDAPPTLASSYAGQDFTATTTWTLENRPLADVLRWMLYRRSPDPPIPQDQWVVWIRQEMTATRTTP